MPLLHTARPTRAWTIPLLLSLFVFVLTTAGCRRSAKPPEPVSPPPPPVAEAPESLEIKQFRVSYKQADGNWRVVPGRPTVWVEATGADEVTFYLAPTGAGETGQVVANARALGEGSRYFASPIDLGNQASTFHIWAVARGKDGSESRSEILDLIHEGFRPEPERLRGFPLYPGFHWRTSGLTAEERQVLQADFGQGFDQGAVQMAVTDWVIDLEPSAVSAWYTNQAAQNGWNTIFTDAEPVAKVRWGMTLQGPEGGSVLVRLAAEEVPQSERAGVLSAERSRLLLIWLSN